MKPEDLVGRRIRFLPYGSGRTCHGMLDDTEVTVREAFDFRTHSEYGNAGFELRFSFNNQNYKQWVYIGLDFGVIDDGEIPYSWRV